MMIIKNKYSINLPSIEKIKNRIVGNGIIMDNVLNTGMTISYILTFLSNHLVLTKIKGLTQARTKGKRIKYIKFPK
jgi:hypothetical protein